MNKRKLLEKAQNSPNNLRFADFLSLIEAFGFSLKHTKGSHYTFTRPGLPALVDVQERGGQAKAYQVEQFLKLVEKYNLKLEE